MSPLGEPHDDRPEVAPAGDADPVLAPLVPGDGDQGAARGVEEAYGAVVVRGDREDRTLAGSHRLPT